MKFYTFEISYWCDFTEINILEIHTIILNFRFFIAGGNFVFLKMTGYDDLIFNKIVTAVFRKNYLIKPFIFFRYLQ